MGAHGVIGVVDRVSQLADTGTTEFHFLGTAVTVEGGPPPAGGVPWTTYLAGQRLTKSIEAGFMPVSVVATLASVRVWAYCMTEYLMEGAMSWGGPIGPQRGRAGEQGAHGRAPAGPQPRAPAAGAAMSCTGPASTWRRRELSQGDEVIDCTLRGNRMRRFKDFDPIAPPRPTVRLS